MRGHALQIDKEQDKDLNWLKEFLKNKKVIGIGEIGLDLYWTKEYKELQIEFFVTIHKAVIEFLL